MEPVDNHEHYEGGANATSTRSANTLRSKILLYQKPKTGVTQHDLNQYHH